MVTNLELTMSYTKVQAGKDNTAKILFSVLLLGVAGTTLLKLRWPARQPYISNYFIHF